MHVRHWPVVLGLLPLLACGQPPASPAPATSSAGAAGSKAPAAGPVQAASGTPATTPGAPSPPPAPGLPPASQEAYTYQPAGRRDPFISLLGSGSVDPRTTTKRGEGPAGLSVNEISVRGVMLSAAKAIAQIQGPDGRNYIIRAGDKFMDGTVTSINAQGLVIVQEVNDPLSTAKQREVRKLLRSQEDAK